MKHSKWIALLIYLFVVVVCFLPWTYHADLGKYFTGFFSEKEVYGKPGKFLIIFSSISIVTNFIPKVWARFTQIFFAGLIMAYALKSYHLYTSSYNFHMPEKQPGIYLLVILSILGFAVSLFPDIKIKNR